MEAITYSLSVLAIAGLFTGYAGVLGHLLQRTWRSQRPLAEGGMTLAYAALLMLPACILILGHTDWHIALRLCVLAFGAAATSLAAVQPPWLPSELWQRPFAQRYFGAAMALASACCLCLALENPALPPALVGTATLTAGIAILLPRPHPARPLPPL
jgi:hypothetical protein